MTLTSSDFLCVANVALAGFRASGLCTEAFLATLDFTAVVFFVAFFDSFALRAATFGFAVFRAALLGTARFAFGRLVLLAVAALGRSFGEARRAAARDVERLRPFVTALMKLQIERVKAESSHCEDASAE